MVTIGEIKTRLAEIAGKITSKDSPVVYVRAYSQAPESLPEPDLPICLFFTGPGADDLESMGEGEDLLTRDMIGRLYIAPVGSGITGEIETLAEPYFSKLRTAFNARPGLSSVAHPAPLAEIFGSQIASDSGLSVLPYGTASAERPAPAYIGIEFRIRIKYLSTFTFAPGE